MKALKLGEGTTQSDRTDDDDLPEASSLILIDIPLKSDTPSSAQS